MTKSVTKQAIDEALKAKNDEIESRTDLTDEEKAAAKSEAKAKADAAKKASTKQQRMQQSTKLRLTEQEKSLQSIQQQ